ncbi:hypothetical protein [Falsirhodobacter halotolerans]|uniref:hypothetical protein n=1 Tax=Falsirhodobacter halotolerans TaxID=1146892 RepID=UPI001FD41471|nr:hypothetical protein [Falsirhodobacter halotolerans]MCJ8138805.1 hypothetical protein [Falsirhodobacter halotolerans]
MDRSTLILSTTAILFVAFALGWFARWLMTRLSPIENGRIDEVDRLAQALHDAEETRDQAIVYAQERERELMAQVGQAEAEFRAVMEALGESRAEVEAMQTEIERLQA